MASSTQEDNQAEANMAEPLKKAGSEEAEGSKAQQASDGEGSDTEQSGGASHYPSVEQLRHMLKNMKIFNVTSLDFYGTVKMHGTHGDIIEPAPGAPLIYQSRNRVLSLEFDNNNFMHHMSQCDLKPLFEKVRSHLAPEQAAEPVMLAGEYCGGAIQKGVALQQLPRMWVLFDIKVGNRWVDFRQFGHVFDESQKIYNVMQFPTWNVTVSTEGDVAEVQEKLVNIALEVEAECPAAKYFGVTGPGEGVVWKSTDSNYNNSRFWFKVKGEKFSVVKVKSKKQLAPVDEEKLQAISEFVQRCVTDNRCNQGVAVLAEMGKSGDLGEFVRWVMKDVEKEEADVAEANGWKTKDWARKVSDAARDWYRANQAMPKGNKQ